MATYNQGLLGGFSGKVGPVVGSTWRGQQVMRSKPKKSKRPPTEAQLLQRLKLSVAMAFLNPIKPLLLKSFKQFPADKNSFSHALSYHMKEALEPTPQGFAIHYPKVLISMGDLRGLENPVLQALPNATLQLLWENNSHQAAANTTDLLLAVVYLPDLNVYEVFTNVASRQDGQALLSLPSNYAGQQAVCWASFTNVTGAKNAVSTAFDMVVLV